MTISFQPDDIEQLRQRLRKMSDEELTDFGLAAKFMCRDKKPRETFVTQLSEARAEWRRRYPKVAK
jgi:uncharacterized protein YjiS (DUF1127 family)